MELEPNSNISFPIGTIRAVQKYYNFLELESVFGPFKKKGRDINSLIQRLLSYKLAENQSVTKASDWINRDEVRMVFELKPFEQRTLYRVLEIIGQNRMEIMGDICDMIFEQYDFEHTNINMDWTSFVLYGTICHFPKVIHTEKILYPY